MQDLTTQLLAERDWLTRFARKLVQDAAAADDLVQETWLKALENLPDQIEHPRGWLATVLRSLHLQRLRSDRRRESREARGARQEALDDVTVALQSAELEQVVAEVISQLANARRQVIVLRYREGWSIARIAHETGVTESAVRSRIQRGLEEVREWMKRRYPEGESAWAIALVPLARRGERVSTEDSVAGEFGASSQPHWIALGAAVAASVIVAFGLMRLGESPAEPGGRVSPPELVSSAAGAELTNTSERASRRVSAEVEGKRSLDFVGRLVDQGGQPLADRYVEVRLGEKLLEVRTDEDGAFKARMEDLDDSLPKFAGLEVVDPRLDRRIEFVAVGPEDRVDFGTYRCERLGAVRIRYKAGRGIAERVLAVLAEPVEASPSKPAMLARPSAGAIQDYEQAEDGAVLRGVAAGNYVLWTRGGLDRWTSTNVEVMVDNITTIDVSGEAADQGEILTIEVASKSGEPIANVRCTATAQASTWTARETHTTDDKGRFEFLVEQGPIDFALGPWNQEFANTRFEVPLGKRTSHRIVVRPFEQLDVLVLDAIGRPVEGASVYFFPATSSDTAWLKRWGHLGQETGRSAWSMKSPGVYRGAPLARPFFVRVSLPIQSRSATSQTAIEVLVEHPAKIGPRLLVKLDTEVEPTLSGEVVDLADEALIVTGRVLGVDSGPRPTVVLVREDRVHDHVVVDREGRFWLTGPLADDLRLVRLPYPASQGIGELLSIAQLANDPRFGFGLPSESRQVELPPARRVRLKGELTGVKEPSAWRIAVAPELDNGLMEEFHRNARQVYDLDEDGEFKLEFAPLDRVHLQLIGPADSSGEPLVFERNEQLEPGGSHQYDAHVLLSSLTIVVSRAFEMGETLKWVVRTDDGWFHHGEQEGPIAAGHRLELPDIPSGDLSLARQKTEGQGLIRVDTSEVVRIGPGSVHEAP